MKFCCTNCFHDRFLKKQILGFSDKIGNCNYCNSSNINILNIEKLQDFFEIIIELYEEKIPFPTLKIRKMSSRWGVCNRKNNSVTLNSQLMMYDVEIIKYVIIHELCHFIHFNHSKSFWDSVEKYCPNYKLLRKTLKN